MRWYKHAAAFIIYLVIYHCSTEMSVIYPRFYRMATLQHDIYIQIINITIYYEEEIIAIEESILLSHMGPPKNAIKSLILVVEQFCVEHFLILFQF